MKLITIPALVLAAAASLTAMTAAATEPPKVADPQVDKAVASKVQPHSHLQEKTGIMPQKKSAKAKPQEEKGVAPATTEEQASATPKAKTADTKKGKVRADKDKTKHFHPRDGK